MNLKTALFLSLFLIFAQAKKPSELFSQIDKSKKSLQITTNQTNAMSKQLREIAKKIKKLNNEILEYDKKLDKLDKNLQIQQQKYNNAKAEIESINNIINELDNDIEMKNREFARLISKQLGSVIAKNKTIDRDEKSVVLKEFLEKYKEYNQQELLKISRNIEQKTELKKSLLSKKAKIAKGIRDVKKQKAIYLREKKKRQELLKKLAKEEKLYQKKLKQTLKKQTLIRLTLAKLNLLQEEAAKEAKKRELELKRRIKELKRLKLANKKARKKALQEGKEVEYKVATINGVKQVGSSYSVGSIAKYRGPKTIPPLKSPRVIRPFGTFVDPIYKIKTFNDSMVLSSAIGDNRVYNVLNGEVSFVGRNAMLGKFVIVKHANNLHTIYADLSKISPFIKVGAKVRKGTVIGKVKKKLIFEATKNGKFINPKRLINI
jgi:murein DD-endopeptidase MepM/ murein hydrolase activator NlpD